MRVNINVYFIEWSKDIKDEEWTCENCGASLNWQSSFNNLYGMSATMLCEECGHNNELSVVALLNTLPSGEYIHDIEVDDGGWYIEEKIRDYLIDKYGIEPDTFQFDYEKID